MPEGLALRTPKITNMEAAVKKGERVRKNTSKKVNEEIERETLRSLETYAHSSASAIKARLKELDKQWDIERTLEINAAVIGLTGTMLAIFVNKKWAILPAIVTGFLAQHAIQGWCPPLPLFRAMGIKTRPELDREKYALKAMRGDFKDVNSVDEAWIAVNK
jgi:hypothetical protein